MFPSTARRASYYVIANPYIARLHSMQFTEAFIAIAIDVSYIRSKVAIAN